MRFLCKCPTCKKRKLFTRRWLFKSKVIGEFRNKGEVCYGCYKNICRVIAKK